MDIRRIGAVKEGDEIIGNETRVKVVKNKIAPPFKQCEFQILYGQGINQLGEVIDLGVQCGLVEKAGSWYAYNGDKIGQGKSNACEYLRENPNVASEIEQKIRAQLMPIVEKKSKVEKDDNPKGKIETPDYILLSILLHKINRTLFLRYGFFMTYHKIKNDH